MAVAYLSSRLLGLFTDVPSVSEHGNSVTHTETTVSAGNSLVIISGGDTTLKGAQASGKAIVADAGGNLTIASDALPI
ncbi:hypothetical protein ASF13_23010 [Erwinia sp. Leaf53]|nr:hypothetical protein ASF13_23010 [Erwinia sp. Leaf53]